MSLYRPKRVIHF